MTKVKTIFLYNVLLNQMLNMVAVITLPPPFE